MIVEWKQSSKQNKIGQLRINNYTFVRAESFNIWVLHSMKITNTKQIYKKEYKMLTKHTSCYKIFLEIKIYLKN